MNAAATQDVRAILTVPLLQRLLSHSKAPNARAAKMLGLLVAWRRAGGNLLDRNGDGTIDNPGAAIMNVAWPKIAAAFMRPELGPLERQFSGLVSVFEGPPAGQFSGW